MDTAALASLARDLLEERRRRHRQPSGSSTDPVPLPQIGAPFFGSGHVFYTVRFLQDGVQWLAKIPAVSDELCRETLRAEALLLHKLRTETAVPVPEVIDADCGNNNAVGVPWLLMEFVRGRRLEDVWFGREGTDARALRGKREIILRNVADAMLRLGTYEFDRGGAWSSITGMASSLARGPCASSMFRPWCIAGSRTRTAKLHPSIAPRDRGIALRICTPPCSTLIRPRACPEGASMSYCGCYFLTSASLSRRGGGGYRRPLPPEEQAGSEKAWRV